MNHISRARSPFERFALLFAGVCVGLFASYVVLILLHVTWASDILYADTLLLQVSEWMYQAVELVAFFTSYAFLLHARFIYGRRAALMTLGIYLVTTVARHAVLWLLRLSTAWAMVVNLIPELIQLGAVALICHACVCTFERTYAVMEDGARRLGCSCPARWTLVYPEKKQPIKKDACLRAAFWSAVLVTGIRILGLRLVYDVMWGWPQDAADALWMLVAYGSDVLIGVGAYFYILLLLRLLLRQAKKQMG